MSAAFVVVTIFFVLGVIVDQVVRPPEECRCPECGKDHYHPSDGDEGWGEDEYQ